ncbi:PREDICTED: uncharacterized protein LOC108564952 [Nicrophorus vespilloides]|uniref:Uncharacterized protein LOC108564952 n=1 Tax=Nicrophorus vespilloides TaxID=110193 RepID=A0ABM1MYJ6_NICVS|nr:PREDICTED: uncharacterized protein LOC108564952 [Nicrophorus vespilloides]
MSLFKFEWLYKIVRRHSKPIPENRAQVWKSRLSIMYMVLAWNAFGVICYTFYKGRGDWAKHHGVSNSEGTPAQQWTRTLGIKDATVYRVKGFNLSRYEIHNDESDLKDKPMFGFQLENETTQSEDSETLTE